MSCFSRLLGLICAVVPGLGFLAFSALLLVRWPHIEPLARSLYALLSFITGAVCLYLGAAILFGRDAKEPDVSPTPQLLESRAPAVAPIIIEAQPLQAAPLPTEVIESPRATAPNSEAATPTIEAATSPQSVPVSVEKTPAPDANAPVSAPPDSPETRIRQLASTRPNWQVTAPQLAHIANINMAVADATAREMASNGQAQLQIGPNGETIYIFDLTDLPD